MYEGLIVHFYLKNPPSHLQSITPMQTHELNRKEQELREKAKVLNGILLLSGEFKDMTTLDIIKLFVVDVTQEIFKKYKIKTTN